MMICFSKDVRIDHGKIRSPVDAERENRLDFKWPSDLREVNIGHLNSIGLDAHM